MSKPLALIALLATLTTFSIAIPAAAQPGASATPQEPAQILGGADTFDVSFVPVITAGATSDNVRFTASSGTASMRVVVASGAFTVFDSGWRSGNVVDWAIGGGQAPAAAPGTYLCTVSVRDISGRETQKKASLTILGDSSVTIGSTDGAALGQLADPRVTMVAHDGTDGELVSTTGNLTFRLGNIFTGSDREAMRLTPEGNLGIGTTTPKAKLDVNGFIRAQGVLFPDGSLLQSGTQSSGVARLSSSTTSGSTNNVTFGTSTVFPSAISGSGTPQQVPKWSDSLGTLVDSAITEKFGVVGVGTTNPLGPLHLYGVPVQDMFAGMGVDLVHGPAFNFGYAGTTFGRSAGFFNVRPDALAVAPNPSLRFMTVNVERMIVTNAGNVGIGTSNPSFLFALGGGASRTMGVDRSPSGAGKALTVTGGAAQLGSTNSAGGDLVLAAGTGTGNAGSGNVRLQGASSNTSGTADAALNDREIIVGKAHQLALTAPASVALVSFAIPAGQVAGGRIQYTIMATDGVSQTVAETGFIRYIATSSGLSCSMSDKLTLGTVNSSCVAGFFNPGSQPGVSIADNIAFTVPAAVAAHEVYFTVHNTSGVPARIE
jgi:hypothetical protein